MLSMLDRNTYSLPCFDELVEDPGVVEGLVEVPVAGRVPRFYVGLGLDVGGDGHQRLLVDPRVAALVEGDDPDVEAGVLPDDLLRVLVRVERVHEDEGHVRAERLVQALNLGKTH